MLALASFLDAMKPDPATGTRGARATAQAQPAAADTAPPGAVSQIQARAEPTALSAVAQLISRLAAGAPQEGRASAALPAAVLPPLPGAAEELPGALKAAISRSGLFYESHLEDWIAGRMPVTELRLEPQGRVPVAAGHASHPALAAPAVPATPHASTDAESAAIAAALARDDAPAPRGHEQWQLPRELEPMVREQLNALAHGSASVPVVPWPGQEATITVRDDEPGEACAGPPACRLELKIDLPQLGAVEFVLAVRGNGIRVAARADQTSSREALNARAGELRDALAARALELQSLQVGERGP